MTQKENITTITEVLDYLEELKIYHKICYPFNLEIICRYKHKKIKLMINTFDTGKISLIASGESWNDCINNLFYEIKHILPQKIREYDQQCQEIEKSR